MIIVIDGYNVLKRHNKTQSFDEKERAHFLGMLDRYGRQKKHKIVVVFDGGLSDWLHKETKGNVTTIFSGRKSSADEIIMHYIEDKKHKDLLLVSSDHELNLFADSCNVVSIGSQEFLSILLHELRSQKVRRTDEDIIFDASEDNFDIIMQQAAQNVPLKEDDIVKEPPFGIGRASKKERILLKKLKKL